MFKSLKVAFRNQKKLILIFLLTIFLPSITLSIFGLIALRNERYRIEQQFREEQVEFIDLIKEKIQQNINELERDLQYLVQTPSFINKNYPEIISLIENHQEENQLSEQFFVVYNGNSPWFPPIRGDESGYPSVKMNGFNVQQKKKLEQAEKYEFSQKNYREAVSLLSELLKTTEDHNLKGQILNLIARNHVKQNNLEEAITIYREIIQDFPNARTSSGTLLSVTVRMQLVECYLDSGLKEEARKESLSAFAEIIRNSNNLSENQFTAYASLAREKFSNIRGEYLDMNSSDTLYVNDFENLNLLYQQKVHRWDVITNLKEECITDISYVLLQEGEYSENAHRFSKKVGSDDLLIISSQIPTETGTLAQGIAGIKLSNTVLEDSLLSEIIKLSNWNTDESLTVTDLSGRVILGDKTVPSEAGEIISFFDDNFPPWRIEVSSSQTRPFLFAGILKSYYFWAILTMMAILGFGIVVIGRTISHEKEVLKLKSDFVSSVSHEFKTPITSIKALTERLLEGTVKDKERIKEYYSVIAQDTENLNHLVGNILDISIMEEGKKQYDFEETDFKGWLEQITSEFFSKATGRRNKFLASVTDPSIQVSIDRNAMKLAITNLLDNAVKFSSENSEIRVILEKQGNNLLLKIIDEGIGIPTHEQAKIFEKFYRAKSALDYSTTGTGLGLTIVKQIIDAHEGEVQVSSEPGRGSTFKILLPLRT